MHFALNKSTHIYWVSGTRNQDIKSEDRKTAQNQESVVVLYSPHSVVGSIRVPRRHRLHHRPNLSVLWELDVIRRQVELWGLVHILHAHVHNGDVLEGPAVAEGRVQVRVGTFHL